MQTRRWTNPTQPQTLQIAVFLLYFNAVFAGLALLSDPVDYDYLVFQGSRPLMRLLLIGGLVGAGYLIANERKIGYALGIGVAVFPVLVRLYASYKYKIDFLGTNTLGLMFDVALVALLAHPQSRDYQRIWFK